MWRNYRSLKAEGIVWVEVISGTNTPALYRKRYDVNSGDRLANAVYEIEGQMIRNERDRMKDDYLDLKELREDALATVSGAG